MSLREIRHLLTELKPNELAQLEQEVKFLRKAKPSVGGPDWLLDGIITELRRRGVIGPQSRPPMRVVLSLLPDYVEQAEAVRLGLLAGVRYKPQPPELLSLGAFAARALADDMDGGPAPVCLQTMLQGLPKMLGAVDKAFPGYLGCGLLGFVLRTQDGP